MVRKKEKCIVSKMGTMCGDKLITLVLITLLCFPFFVFAETIVLKSGKSVEGKLLEKTDKYIKIDFYGVPLTFFNEEVEKSESTEEDLRKRDEERAAISEIGIEASRYIGNGQFNKVEEVYKAGLKKFPNNALLWAARAGNILDQGNIDKAIEYCNQSLSLDSCCAEAYFVLGLVYAKKKSEDKAVGYFQEAIKCNPDFAMAYYDLGVSYFSNRKLSEAVDSWVKATQLDKVGMMQKKIEDVINLYIQNVSNSKTIIEKVAETKPWILLPPVEVSQKKIFESVLLEYKTKLQVQGSPDFVYYMNLGGISYYYRGEFEKSLKQINIALDMLKRDFELPEKEKQKYMNYIYRLLGDVHLTFFEFEPAEQNYHKALEIDPNDTNSLCGLAIVQTVKGNFKEARKIYRSALNLNSNSAFAQEALRLLDVYKK
jgi:tetratricopeptide (TPR) repeat protein